MKSKNNIIIVLAVVLIIIIGSLLFFRKGEDQKSSDQPSSLPKENKAAKEELETSVKELLASIENNQLIDKNFTIKNGKFVDEIIQIGTKLPTEGSINVSADGKIALALRNDNYCVLKDSLASKSTTTNRIYDCKIATPSSCFKYASEEKEAKIIYYEGGENCPKEVVIPVVIDDMLVTSIGNQAFTFENLTSVYIPTSVRKIEFMAFNNNDFAADQAFIYQRNSDGTNDYTNIVSYAGKNREKVVIPSGVKKISDAAFMHCGIKEVVLPSSVVEIGNNSFASNQLSKISLPKNIKNIGYGAFNANQLPGNQAFIYQLKDGKTDKSVLISYGGLLKEEVKIPSNVKTIGSYALAGTYLKSVSIPNSVTKIMSSAFESNSLLSGSVAIDNIKDNVEIDETAFKNNGIDYISKIEPEFLR